MKNKTLKFMLSEIMHERKLSLRAAAKLTGISRNGLAVLCGDPTQIRMDTIVKLCIGLGIAPADLFQLETKK